MPTPLVTVLLGDPALPDRSKPGGRFTEDDLDQVRRLRAALAQIDGFRFEYLADHDTLIERLVRAPPAFVLNFCDTGFRNVAAHEPHVAALLEMLGIAYSGSGPLALATCFDKSAVRALAQAQGIPVPAEVFIPSGAPVPALDYPVFIKPNRADGSLGITRDSIAHDEEQARAYMARLRAELPGADLLAQEWLTGTEFGVGVVGNPGADFDVLPILEVDYTALDPALPRLLDYGSKTDPNSPYWRDVKFRAATLEPALAGALRGWCETLFTRLGLRDYARLDFRVDAAGTARLMEVNPNPAWCWDGKLAHMAASAGRSHADLLGAIVRASWGRCFGPA